MSQIDTYYDKMTQARVDLDNYSIRVLDVVKGRYGLKNRNDALKKFVHLYGDNFVEPEFDEKETMMLRDIVDKYEATGKKKSMSMDDVDDLLGI